MTPSPSSICALVTGASQGLGLACARELAAQGGQVILHANRSLAAAQVAAATLGDRALGVIAADLSEPGAGARLFAEAEQLSGGRLNVVVNNAGIQLASPLADNAAAWALAWQQVLQVNLLALADICRAAVLTFAERGGGCLINIASRAGFRGDDDDHSAYAASKGAVLALTKTLARARAAQGILAYALAPGWIDTAMAPQSGPARQQAVADIPLGRMATPDEVAAMVAFLASGRCASATGACIDINGASYVR